MNILDKEYAKKEILNLLGDNANNERIRNELALLIDKNYIEILLAKKTTDYLNNHNEYYYVRGSYPNLNINYLLGITKIDPTNNNTLLPYELFFEGNNKDSFRYEINVSTKIKDKLIKYLNELVNNTLVMGYYYDDDGNKLEIDYKCLIPLNNDDDLSVNYWKIDESNYVEMNIYGFKECDDINYFINKYGYPKYDIFSDKRINNEIFNTNHIYGTLAESKIFNNILKSVDEDNRSFDTYVSMLGAVSGNNILDHFEDKIIDSKTIHDYPTSREKIYELCKELGKSHEDAIRIAILSKKRISEYDQYYDEWAKLVVGLPEYLIEYLYKIKYIFSLAHLINGSKFDYLEMYYKLTAPDYYEVKLGKYLKIFNKLDKEEIELLTDDLINNHNSNYDNNLRLYLDYKNRA